MTRRKIAILGYTDHRAQAPFPDNDWELWGLNDLYYELPENIEAERWRWFQLHPWNEIAEWKKVPVTADPMNFSGGPAHPRDPNHVPWLAQTAKVLPLYMMEPRAEVPDARIYPKAEAFKYFSLDGVDPMMYFTNSISWMIALAIMELCPGGIGTLAETGSEIGIYGVDMMMGGGDGSEYGYQRPSCEFFIGIARGMGITIRIPKVSDLLHSAFTYGDGKASDLRKKIDEMWNMYGGRLDQLKGQQSQIVAATNNLSGARDTLEWLRRSWLPGDSDTPRVGRAPFPGANVGPAGMPPMPTPAAPVGEVKVDIDIDAMLAALDQRSAMLGKRLVLMPASDGATE